MKKIIRVIRDLLKIQWLFLGIGFNLLIWILFIAPLNFDEFCNKQANKIKYHKMGLKQ